MPTPYKIENINPSILGLEPNIKISKERYLNLRELTTRDVDTRDAPSIGTINNINVL